jgi:hypothetical protein
MNNMRLPARVLLGAVAALAGSNRLGAQLSTPVVRRIESRVNSRLGWLPVNGRKDAALSG